MDENTPAEEKTRAIFETNHLMADLAGLSVRGGAFTAVGQIGKFALQLASIIVLARLLTPQDFGLLAMVTAITGFVALFKDMGLSMATVQRAEINHSQISTLFWFNVAIGVLMAVFVSGIAPVIAWFYSEPRVLWITVVSSVAFIFGGLTVQHQALLRRQMRFGALAGIEITATLVAVATAIASACYGAGYWALVLLPIVAALTIAAGVWIKCGWRPGPPVRHSGVRTMLAFGGNITGFNVVNYFARNLDKVLIGRYWGAQPLGLYDRAYRLLLFPLRQINAPISAVAIPALSRLQNDAQQYRRYYLKIISLIAFVTMPGVMFMIVMSKPLIGLVLGSRWIGASKIFAILGVSALIQPITNTSGWLFVSQGRATELIKWGFIGATITIISIFIGLPWGAVGVATSYTIIGICIRTPLLFWFVGRKGPIGTIDFYRALSLPVIMAFCVLLSLLLGRHLMGPSHRSLAHLLGFALASGTVLLTLVVLPTGRKLLDDLKKITGFLMVKRKTPK